MEHINKILTDIKEEGLFKRERTITTPRGVVIVLSLLKRPSSFMSVNILFICSTGIIYHFKTTFPQFPDSIILNASWNWSIGILWVRTWEISSPLLSIWVILYHVSYISLPYIPLTFKPLKMILSRDNIIFKGLNVKGIYGREMYETWYKMTQMLRSGLDISQVLTHRIPIDQFQDAFKIMESGNCGKVVLKW